MPLIAVIDDDTPSASQSSNSRNPSTTPPIIQEAPETETETESRNDNLNQLASTLYTIQVPTDDSKLEEVYTKTLRGVEGILTRVGNYSSSGYGEVLDKNHAEELMEYLATVGRPRGGLFRPREVKEMEDEDEERKEEGRDVTKERLISLYHQLTIKILTLFTSLLLTHVVSQSTPTLLVTFTDPLEPWTTPESYNLSQSLHHHLFSPNTNTPSNPIEQILTSTIKPLFAPYTKQTTTSHHLAPSLTRTAMSQSFTRKAPAPRLHSSETPIPWIDDRPETITLLKFIVNTTSKSSAPGLTPLLLPPLLTLLDYPAHIHTTKPTALSLLGKFAKALPRDYLLPPPKGRGLGEVIWDAAFPYLHWLPPLTPESASVWILKTAYLTLVRLLEKMYPPISSYEHEPYLLSYKNHEHQKVKELCNSERESGRERQRRLDCIMREGIKNAVAFCGENVAIMGAVLFALEPDQKEVRELGLVRAMRIGSVKYLDFLVPWLCGILSNPFSVLQAELLVSGAVRALKTVLVEGGAWVRIRYPDEDGEEEEEDMDEGKGGWQWEILGGCIDAWRALNDEVESLNSSTSPSAARKIVDVTEEQKKGEERGKKRRVIWMAMNKLVGLVGLLEWICVYRDPKSGETLGKEEWGGVVKGLMQVEELGESEGCGIDNQKMRDMKLREMRILQGVEVHDEARWDGDISMARKRSIRELLVLTRLLADQ